MSIVKIISGDITEIDNDRDAITTLIDPMGYGYGYVNQAIIKKCGDFYHLQLKKLLEKKSKIDNQVFIIRGGVLKNVIFTIDNLNKLLRELVFSTLKVAEESSFKKIAIPLMRTGAMSSYKEENNKAAIVEIERGISLFYKNYPNSNLAVDIIVYNDEYLEKIAKKEILGC